MTNRTRTDALLLAGFCAFLFFYGIAQFGLIGADEPRYAQVAHEMLERHDWITPTLGGQPWLEKPPLYYWQAIVAYKILGVSDVSARLPSAFDATLLVLAVYLFLRRFRKGSELDGALIVASCAGIIGYARAASTDMPLAAAFAIAMLAWWAWRESGNQLYLFFCYIFIAFGTLAKGPIAPLLAVLVIVCYAAAVHDWRIVLKSFSILGIILFFAIALPWYLLAQKHNPQFLREFIIDQNLGRFSQNLYHHTQPFWYYLPVAALAIIPWTIFIIVSICDSIRRWGREPNQIQPAENDFRIHLDIYACCWLLVPIVFFSLSQSKLPGYILPAVPAAGLLLASYLHQRLAQSETQPVSKALVVLHSLTAAMPMVPALLIAYIVTQHRLPGGRPMLGALVFAFVLCAAIALTLAGRSGWRMFRFVTLIPVVLAVAAVLKLGSIPIDEYLSARPLANDIASIETERLPLAVYHVPRELEYGLTFYRNQLTVNYAWSKIPQQEHLLVAPEDSQVEVAKLVPGRRVSFLGHYAPQHVDYFWIAAATADSGH